VTALTVGLAIGAGSLVAWAARSRTRELMWAVLRRPSAAPREGTLGAALRSRGARAWRRPAVRSGAVAASLGVVGWKLMGPIGFLGGAGVGLAVIRLRWRQARRSRAEALEHQLGALSETMALALRSGLSVAQALEFAVSEAQPPMARLLATFLDERRLGTPFDRALDHLADSLGTEDARLFALVVGIHARSGGDLAGALEEVTEAIRHRIAVRTELRALSAQGRVSGAIMGSLPIAFLLVLATTSRRQLGPVYRSAPGIAMLAAGLSMEGLAYLWIRHLLRIEG
jgi:tight adherence protein B